MVLTHFPLLIGQCRENYVCGLFAYLSIFGNIIIKPAPYMHVLEKLEEEGGHFPLLRHLTGSLQSAYLQSKVCSWHHSSISENPVILSDGFD